MESQKKYWNVDPASGALLQALLHTHKPLHILEVGTSNGYSAILMGHVAKQYEGHIQTIEFFKERVNMARENIQREGLTDTIEILQGDAIDILPTLPGPYEFVFLDANKEEHGEYFKYAVQLMPSGGIIVADNTISHRKKLASFFEAVQKEERADALDLQIGTGLMVIKVTKSQ